MIQYNTIYRLVICNVCTIGRQISKTCTYYYLHTLHFLSFPESFPNSTIHLDPLQHTAGAAVACQILTCGVLHNSAFWPVGWPGGYLSMQGFLVLTALF